MIFETINSTLTKPSFTITIANIDSARYHWGGEKSIQNNLTSIEDFLYEPDLFDDRLMNFACSLIHANTRVRSLSFYRIPAENRLIILAKTDVARLKQPEILSREMSIKFHKHNFTLSVIELLESEEKKMQETGRKLPENWVADDTLNNRYRKLTAFL
jgi:hypothetical protein